MAVSIILFSFGKRSAAGMYTLVSDSRSIYYIDALHERALMQGSATTNVRSHAFLLFFRAKAAAIPSGDGRVRESAPQLSVCPADLTSTHAPSLGGAAVRAKFGPE